MKKILMLLILFLSLGANAYASNSTLEFDGVNDMVQVPDSDSWSFKQGNFTIETWVKFYSIKETALISQGPNNWHYWVLNYDPVQATNGVLEFVSGHYDGPPPDISLYAPYGINVNQWTHFAITRSGTTANDWKVYINGISCYFEKRSGPWDATLTDFSDPLYLGANPSRYVETFLDGQIDELRIWDYARTPQQLNDRMNSELYGNEPGLVAYWNFNEGSGDILHDLSGNGHDGQLYSSSGGEGPVWVESTSPVAPIPEPATILLFGIGGLLTAIARRKKM